VIMVGALGLAERPVNSLQSAHVNATLPSHWSDQALLQDLYSELLMDDDWRAPTQAQLTTIQKQSMDPTDVQEIRGVTVSKNGEYLRWQPNAKWPESMRVFTGRPGSWSAMALDMVSMLTFYNLTEASMVLDVGCGALRMGQMVIPFLARGHYHCVDPARGLVQDAVKLQLGYDILQRKLPSFAFNPDFLAPPGLSASLVGDDPAATAAQPMYDIIVAQSIFTHTADDLFNTAMRNLRPRLGSNSIMLATVFFEDYLGIAVPSDEATGWVYPGDLDTPGFISFTEGHLTSLLAAHGLKWERANWPKTPEAGQIWVAISLAS